MEAETEVRQGSRGGFCFLLIALPLKSSAIAKSEKPKDTQREAYISLSHFMIINDDLSIFGGVVKPRPCFQGEPTWISLSCSHPWFWFLSTLSAIEGCS
ncbi:hypothetical protein MRB53_014215 [Persea americana]|uniref:Uncharacterized protein n=1 Tax=Persea americana TaxID=3435 RepID=A0ACC2KAQ0_PERAE|nr:hypothetical protein MRB53_014215 [Persea americana]